MSRLCVQLTRPDSKSSFQMTLSLVPLPHGVAVPLNRGLKLHCVGSARSWVALIALAICWQSAAVMAGAAGDGVLGTVETFLIAAPVRAEHDACRPSANSGKPELGIRKCVWLYHQMLAA